MLSIFIGRHEDSIGKPDSVFENDLPIDKRLTEFTKQVV